MIRNNKPNNQTYKLPLNFKQIQKLRANKLYNIIKLLIVIQKKKFRP